MSYNIWQFLCYSLCRISILGFSLSGQRERFDETINSHTEDRPCSLENIGAFLLWQYGSIECLTNIYVPIENPTNNSVQQCRRQPKKCISKNIRTKQCGLLKLKHLEKVSRIAAQASVFMIIMCVCFFVMNSFFSFIYCSFPNDS